MISAARAKRRTASRRLDLLHRLRPLLRAHVDPERMIRSVTTLLAVEVGQYCISDLLDRRDVLRRVEIEHADPSHRARLRAVCEDTTFEEGGRVARLLARGGSELLPRVSDEARTTDLRDIVLLRDERVKSYMAVAVVASGTPIGVLTLVTTQGTRRFGKDDLALLEEIADWTGLGLENALRREAQPRTSLLPTADDEAPVSRRTPQRHRA
jgi:GAF domain-containing protein